MNSNTPSKYFQALSSFFSRHSRVTPGALALGLCALLTGCGADLPSAGEEEASLTTQASNLYVASSEVWTTKNIPVCWENASPNNATQRDWVRSAVADTWVAHSAVNFTGWGTCGSSSTGVRINISDEVPHTKRLGQGLSEVRPGMILNFTFQNWNTSFCQNRKEFCIRVIAVHEFGHALGFAHEQNRSDTPSSCKEPAQGGNGDITIGAWDKDSVMNYCNTNWDGDGKLSATDIQGVQQVYGKR